MHLLEEKKIDLIWLQSALIEIKYFNLVFFFTSKNIYLTQTFEHFFNSVCKLKFDGILSLTLFLLYFLFLIIMTTNITKI